MNKLISVIVPCYNSEKYIDRCIDSLLRQSYKHFELIVINDGSTDNSLSKIKYWSSVDKRICIISQKNLGRSVARNKGIDISNGDYITFVDSDDFVSSDYLSHLLVGMKMGAEISMIGLSLTNMNLKMISPGKYSRLKPQMLSGEKAMERVLTQTPDSEVCGKMFLSGLFEDIRFPENFIYEDFQVTISLLCNVNRVFFQNTEDYFYIQRPDSTMNVSFSRKKLDIISVGESVRKVCLEKYPELEVQLMGRLFAAYSNVWMQIKNDDFKNDSDKLWNKMIECRGKILFQNIDNPKVYAGVYISLLGRRIFKLVYFLVSKK